MSYGLVRSVIRGIGYASIGLVAGGVVGLGTIAGLNYASHNRDSINTETGTITLSKPDGISDHTQFIKQRNGVVTLSRQVPFGVSRIFNDLDADGNVDEYITFSLTPIHFARYQRNTHPEILKKVDKEFKEQVDRFRPDLESMLSKANSS